MLINYNYPKHVYIVCGNTDLRKGINSLALLISDYYEMDVYDDSLFLFCGRRNDRFKGLYWDGEGFTMLYKRFENGRLQWPRNREEVSELTQQQVECLLQGLNPLPEKRIKPAKKGTFY